MVQWRSVNPLRLLLVGLLCFCLGGCGWLNPHPPRAVVASAIASKLNQTQALLSDQLGLADQSETALQVSRVQITQDHWMTINQQPVMQVRGTYRLSGRGWRQQHRPQPFEIYLKRGDGQQQWLLVDQS
jgi:hypothetical protein